jgi:nucleoside-diphosphate-sugar epimerase
MKHILVLGGCGYKGTVLVQVLLKKGYKVTVFDIMWFGNYLSSHENLSIVKGDIRNIDNVSMNGVDVVIHLANVANDPTCDLNPKFSWEVNVLATKFLAEKAIKNGVEQFIYASSGSVYGLKEELNVTENLDLVPLSDYNKTKMISERVLLSYSDKIQIQIIRPATVCGYSPRMRLDVSVNMLTFQALKNKKITVFGGEQTRPNIHMKDIINVYLHFLENNSLAGIYNAGFENISIMDIAKKVNEFLPCEITVTESNDSRSYRLNSDKLLSTGFEQKYGYEDGIKDVSNAYDFNLLSGSDNFYNIKTMKKQLLSN